MILLAPLAVFVIIALGVRSRRASANLALLAPLASLAGVLLAGASVLHKKAPYDGSYEWLNIATAFSGPARFQVYIFDVGIRVSHLTAVLMLGVIAISLAVLAWSRVGARGEPSPARYHGLLTLLLACALGVVASTDLIELYVFWGIGAVATYLLLSNSWADEEGTAAGRLALAVPAVTDLALLAGIALLYSRFGQLNFDQLIPGIAQLGLQPRTMATASVLIFAGAAGRIGLFPFQGWLSAGGPAPTGALAAAQGMWTLMAAGLIYKMMPVAVQSTSLPLRTVAATAALSAIGLPLLGLASRDVRRAVTDAGIAVSALGVLAFARPGGVAAAALLLTATGLARTALVLGVGTVVAGMRTALAAEMGEGYRRMRLSVLTLPLAAIGLVLGVGQVATSALRWHWALAYGLGMALAVLGLLRLYLLAGHALLPRRRGFDPNRVRAAPASMSYPPLLLALLSVVLSAGFFIDRWLGFADNRAHHGPETSVTLAWLAIPLAAAFAATVLFYWRRDLGAGLTERAAIAWSASYGRGRAVLARLLVEPSLDLAEHAETGLVGGGEVGLGRLIEDSARVVRRPLPILPLLAGVAVLAAIVAALAAPGVFR